MMRDRPPLTCVIDPTLALTQHGLSLTQQLAQEVELWIAREFWHILDNPIFYQQHPELVTPKEVGLAYPQRKGIDLDETLRSLQAWERFRRSQDLAGLNLFWLGDSPEKSYLPKRRSLDIFWRWELIAQSLDHKIELNQPNQGTDDVIPLFVRDTVALAASLDSVMILSHKRSTDFEQHLPPQICQILEQWGFLCKEITGKDSMVELERKALHHTLIQSNTAKFLWSGMHLAILHLLISVNPKMNIESSLMSVNSCSILEDSNVKEELKELPSINIKGFWYSL
jgi:hypothetical protein